MLQLLWAPPPTSYPPGWSHSSRVILSAWFSLPSPNRVVTQCLHVSIATHAHLWNCTFHSVLLVRVGFSIRLNHELQGRDQVWVFPFAHLWLCGSLQKILKKMGKRPAYLSPEKPICKSVSQFSCSVMSNSLPPHRLQHARLPCPSPTLKACSNSRPSCQWCHPAISSSIISFSSCLQSFPASGSYPRSQFFTSSGQSIGVSASVSVLPINIQDWFPLGLIGWISLQSRGLSRVFTVKKQ